MSAVLEISFLGAALAGLLSFFTPCILPMVPFYLSYMAGLSMSELREDGAIATGAQRRLVVSALAFAEVLYMTTGRDLAQAFLAFSPGGLTEMSLLALALGQEVAYVASAHIARIVLVIFCTPIAFRLLGPRLRAQPPRTETTETDT